MLHGPGAPGVGSARGGDVDVDVTSHVFYGPFDGSSWGDGVALLAPDAGERDPVFQQSVAAGLTESRLAGWDQAVSWGDHAAQGYLKEELDPKVGALDAGQVPMWGTTGLVTSALTQQQGRVGVGTSTPAGQLSVGSVADVGVQFPTNTGAQCTIGGNRWLHTVPSAGPCNSYCVTRGYTSGVVSGFITQTCGGSTCSYVTDFSTCATATIPNNGNCDTCAKDMICRCYSTGSVFQGELRVNDFLRLSTTTGAPPSGECVPSLNHPGRMKFDPATGTLYLCGNTGRWYAK